MQQEPELTPGFINKNLTDMKRALSQTEGEINTMRGDVQSSIFTSLANMFNKLVNDKFALETQIKELQATLDKIYLGHPDIKINMEAEKKESPITYAKPNKKQ